MKILITGTAGFIGFHLTRYLLHRGDNVVGLDNINDYYDIKLKHARLLETGISIENVKKNELVSSNTFSRYRFVKADLTDLVYLKELFDSEKFDVVCNLAAQAGVRYSLINPQAYIDSNIQGFLNVLECCRSYKIKHLVYASSSSVYGLNNRIPFIESDKTESPISLYAASKKSNELMAHTYSHLFGLPSTGLRFFTVYGPWGRPDMALYLFTKAILENKPIKVFNNGNMKRDFTYIDDIIEGIVLVIDNPPLTESPAKNGSLYRVYNIGNGSPVNLMDFVSEIEKKVNVEAIREYMPMQPGDVESTWADIKEMQTTFDYIPKYSVQQGVANFVNWYIQYSNTRARL